MKILDTLGCVLVGAFLSSTALAVHVNGTLPPNSRLQDIAKFTNNRDTSAVLLSVIIAPNDQVLGLYSVYELNDGTGTVTRDVMPIEEIESPEGSVLHEEDGFKIFILQGRVDSHDGTARLQVRYLTNALTNRYESCRINAKRSVQGTWTLYNAYNGKVVTEARARVWALGIKTIENICP